MPDAFVRSYIAAALWSSVDEHDEPLDRRYDEDSLAPEALASIESDCARFQAENADALAQADRVGHDVPDTAGFDFWLTRNGHGAGFWDEPKRYPNGTHDTLSEAAHAFGPSDIYVGDDGQLYVS